MKSKKIIFLVLISLVSGCSLKNDYYYVNISNQVMNMYADLIYDDTDINSDDNKVLKKYYSDLLYGKNVIELDQYIIYKDSFYVDEENSDGVYEEDGKCYVRYEDINFIEDETRDDYADLVCKGYVISISKDEFRAYNNEINYEYEYLGFYKNNSEYIVGYNLVNDNTNRLVHLVIDNNKLVSIDFETNYFDEEKAIQITSFDKFLTSDMFFCLVIGLFSVVAIIVVVFSIIIKRRNYF